MGADEFGILPGEAKPQRPVMKDWSGQVWNERPDVVLRGYVRNISILTPENLNWIEGRIAERDWTAISKFLQQKRDVADADDIPRFDRALDVVDKVSKPGG